MKRQGDGKIYSNKTPRGQSRLKGIYKSSLITVLRNDNMFRRKYDFMRENGSNSKVAENAIYRKLAATTLGVWKTGKKYNDHYKGVTQKKVAIKNSLVLCRLTKGNYF